jgi:hypothetical protein
MQKICLLYLAGAFLLFGCTIDDEDRCPSGYEYIVKDKICFLIVEDAGEEPEEDAGEEPDGSLPEGFWDTCNSEGDCSNPDADFCVAMPGEDGNCTYTGCDPDVDPCPSGFICCNCTAFSFIGEVLCGPAEWADSAFMSSQCDCE